MAFSSRSKHSSDRKHEYDDVITTDKTRHLPVRLGEQVWGEKGKVLLFPSTQVRLSEKGRRQHPQSPSLPVTGAQDATKVKVGISHH